MISHWPQCMRTVAPCTLWMARTRYTNARWQNRCCANMASGVSKDIQLPMDDPFLLRHQNAAELLLIRHGDAIPGPEEIIPSGVYDNLPLSSIGREQAQSLAERLGGMHFDAIYSSPLKRCQQTAAPLAERLGLTPVIVPNI